MLFTVSMSFLMYNKSSDVIIVMFFVVVVCYQARSGVLCHRRRKINTNNSTHC